MKISAVVNEICYIGDENLFFITSLRYLLLLLNKTTCRIIYCMFKHLTHSLELTSDSFTTFTAAERQLNRHLKLCTSGKYKYYCKHQNEISTNGHVAKKGREQNLSLYEQKNLKKKRQDNVSNQVAKCQALKKVRVNNNAN